MKYQKVESIEYVYHALKLSSNRQLAVITASSASYFDSLNPRNKGRISKVFAL